MRGQVHPDNGTRIVVQQESFGSMCTNDLVFFNVDEHRVAWLMLNCPGAALGRHQLNVRFS